MQKFILDDHWKIETEFTKNREDLQGGQGYKLKSSNSTRVTIFQVFRLKQLGNTWDSYGNWESGKLLLPKFHIGCRFHRPSDASPAGQLEYIARGWRESAGRAGCRGIRWWKPYVLFSSNYRSSSGLCILHHRPFLHVALDLSSASVH
jgi:hypothetical protein